MTEKKEKKYYFPKNDMMECIHKHRERCRIADEKGVRRPNIPDYAGIKLQEMCEQIASRGNFSGYSFKREMIQDALLDCIAAFEKFNPERSQNPFGYFSRVAWVAMLRRIYDEKKENYVKHKNFIRLYGTGDHYIGHEDWTDPRAIRVTPEVGSKTDVANNVSVSDDIIKNFEDLLERRKKVRE